MASSPSDSSTSDFMMMSSVSYEFHDSESVPTSIGLRCFSSNLSFRIQREVRVLIN